MWKVKSWCGMNKSQIDYNIKKKVWIKLTLWWFKRYQKKQWWRRGRNLMTYVLSNNQIWMMVSTGPRPAFWEWKGNTGRPLGCFSVPCRISLRPTQKFSNKSSSKTFTILPIGNSVSKREGERESESEWKGHAEGQRWDNKKDKVALTCYKNQ